MKLDTETETAAVTVVGRRRYIIAGGLMLLVTLGYMDRINMSTAGAQIIAQFGLTTGDYGLLTSVFNWAYLALLIPVGLMADKWGARWVLPISVIIWSIGSGFTGLSIGIGALVAARLMLGAGESTIYPVGNATIQEWAPRQERARFAGMLNAGALVGPAVGAILSAYLIASLGWRSSFVILGVFGAIVGIAWFLVYKKPEEAKWLSASEREFILRERVDPIQDAQTVKQARLTLPQLLAKPTMWGLLLAHGCAAFTNYLFLSFLPLYLETERHLGTLFSGWVTGGIYAFAAVGSIAVAYFSDRIIPPSKLKSGGRRKLVVIVLLLGLPLLALPWVTNVPALVILISYVLVMITSAMTLNYALAGDLIQGNSAKGRVFSLVTIGGNVFGLLAPIVTGFLVQATGSYTGPFILAGTLLGVGAIITATLSKRTLTAQNHS
jgi:MFS family permease